MILAGKNLHKTYEERNFRNRKEDFTMKTRKMVLLVLLAMGLVAAFSASSYAAAANYSCQVAWAGTTTWTGSATTYQTAIRLNYLSGAPVPTVTSKTFYAPAGREKDFLATALTAMANNIKVAALVDFQTSSATTVNNFYLTP